MLRTFIFHRSRRSRPVSTACGGVRRGVVFALLALVAFAPAGLRAFPPAPFHTIFGLVRDENGNALQVEGAQIVFYKDSVEVLRETIREGRQLDQNFQIRLRMDMFRLGSRTYTTQANTTGATFTLAVLIHDVPYFPIEMSASRSVGKPGERVRLDLTLGVDADGDGLPDAWEQSQLYAGGLLPGANGWDLSLINRTADFDRDGLTNWQEYVAGTFATDATDYLSLQIKEALASHARLQFFSIYGKVYSLESSTDLTTWTAVPLYLRNPESTDSDDIANPPVAQTSLKATATGIVDLYAPASGTARTFYRLNVR